MELVAPTGPWREQPFVRARDATGRMHTWRIQGIGAVLCQTTSTGDDGTVRVNGLPRGMGDGEAQLVERALADLPPRFAKALEELTIVIQDRPSRKLLRNLGMEDDELLLGLHTGRPITERSVEDSGAMPDQILIFQEDCELASDSEEELIKEVRTTVLHELGHHFGLSEEDLDHLGYG